MTSFLLCRLELREVLTRDADDDCTVDLLRARMLLDCVDDERLLHGDRQHKDVRKKSHLFVSIIRPFRTFPELLDNILRTVSVILSN